MGDVWYVSHRELTHTYVCCLLCCSICDLYVDGLSVENPHVGQSKSVSVTVCPTSPAVPLVEGPTSLRGTLLLSTAL